MGGGLGYFSVLDHSFTIQVGVPHAFFSYISSANRDAG